MDGQRLTERMRQAEGRLARAIAALQQAEGSMEPVFRYQADGAARATHELLLAEYREAEAEAEAAYCAWRQWQRRQALRVAEPLAGPEPEQRGQSQAVAGARGVPSAVSARLRFTRWLYRSGHIAG